MDHIQMTKAYKELGIIPLRVLLVRRNLAWADRILNHDDPRLPPHCDSQSNGLWEEIERLDSSAVV